MSEGHHGFTFAVGDVLEGRYKLNKLLGEGGFGAVYRATQLNIEREVAVKVVLPQMLTMEGGVERFLREAKVAQRLDHPNTVRMYDQGSTADGVPYIAWELLRGQELEEAMKEGPMAPERVLRIIGQALKALMEAHSLSIVHRDIKPANIFLTDFSGEPDFVKILDFGIAKALDSTDEASSKNLTMAGQIIGTPSYMSPEQVKGENVGSQADLYSLGLVMAEMLTGQVVYNGTGLAICAAHLSPAPTPLSPELQNSSIGQIIAKATQKEPTYRYQTAKEMLDDCKQVSGELGAGMAMTPAVGLQSGPWSGNSSYTSTPAPGMSTGNVGPSQLTPGPVVTGPTSMATAPPKSSNTLVIVLGLLAALVVVVLLAVGGIALVVNNNGNNNSSSGGGSTQIVPPNNTGGNTGYNTGGNTGYNTGGNTGGNTGYNTGGTTSPNVNGNLAALNSHVITQKIQEQGYSLLQQPQVQDSGVVSTTVVTGLRGSTAATVMLYHYQYPMGISAMEASLRQQGQGAVSSDGQRLLYVQVSGQGGGQAQSQQLLQHLMR